MSAPDRQHPDKRSAPWTTRQEAQVRSLYGQATAAEVAQQIGCSTFQVEYKVRRLGLRKRRGWTGEEDAIVSAQYAAVGADLVCESLEGRSVHSVYHRAKALGLSRRRIRLQLDRRPRWPDAVFVRALELFETERGYTRVVRRLEQEFTPSPGWATVRDWCTGRIRRGR